MKYAVLGWLLCLCVAGFVTGASGAELDNRVETLKKIDGIRRAMDAYALNYGRVPCPTNSNLTVISEQFGKEILNDTNCGSDAGYMAGEVVAGSVPVRALSLPDSFMFDAWGRRMLYVIDQRFAASGEFQQELDNADVVDLTSYHFTADSDIEIRNTIGGDILYSNTPLIGLILSYGRNGNAAFTRKGIRLDAGSDQDELENSHYQGGGAFNSLFISKTPTDSFDDVLRIVRRSKNIPLYCLGVDVPSRIGGSTPIGDGYPAYDWPNTVAGTTAELTCSPGYTGTVTRECNTDGQWGGIVSTCNCDTKLLTDGDTYSGTWPKGDDVGTVIGDTYTLTEAADNVCLPGFEGDVTAECQPSGGWVVVTNNCAGDGDGDGNNGHGNDDDGDDDSNPGGGGGNGDDGNNGHGNDDDGNDDTNPGNGCNGQGNGNNGQNGGC